MARERVRYEKLPRRPSTGKEPVGSTRRKHEDPAANLSHVFVSDDHKAALSMTPVIPQREEEAAPTKPVDKSDLHGDEDS